MSKSFGCPLVAGGYQRASMNFDVALFSSLIAQLPGAEYLPNAQSVKTKIYRKLPKCRLMLPLLVCATPAAFES